MLAASAERIIRELPEDAVVLDIGGWARPFVRADWVMDIAPHGTRGMLGVDGYGDERFTPESWIQRDICDREPYPFEDRSVDFVVCAHTLEDIRDPVWVCSEMQRIGKAGYIEVPSRLEEQSYGFQGDLVGWGHHRWLVDVGERSIEFVFKSWRLRADENHFPAGFREQLGEEQRVQTLWWRDGFDFGERICQSREEVDAYLSGFVAQVLDKPPAAAGGLFARLRRVVTPRG